MTQDQMRTWLIGYVAQLLEFEQSQVKTTIPLSRYGFDSLAAAALTEDLGKVLGRTIEPTVLYEHRTIDAIAAFLADVK